MTKALQSRWVVRLIGVGKLFKAAALLMVAVAAFHLIHADLAAKVEGWVEALRVDPDNRFVHAVIRTILGLNPARLRAISVGTFFYAVLYGTEGMGLLWDKVWAEWLTVISTAGFLPLELFVLWERRTGVRFCILILNVAILVYLVRRLRQRGKEKSAAPTQGFPVAARGEAAAAGPVA